MQYPVNQFVDDLNDILKNAPSKHKYEYALCKGISDKGFNFCITLLNLYNLDNIDYVYNGSTALIIASEHGYLGLVELLIKKGANIEASNIDKCTSLFMATLKNHYEVVNILINNGANANVSAYNIRRPVLMEAILNDNIKIFEILIDNGANINASDNRGQTALMCAVLLTRLNYVKLLLDKNVNVSAIDCDNKSALNHAYNVCTKSMNSLFFNESKEIVQLLKDYETKTENNTTNIENVSPKMEPSNNVLNTIDGEKIAIPLSLSKQRPIIKMLYSDNIKNPDFRLRESG